MDGSDYDKRTLWISIAVTAVAAIAVVAHLVWPHLKIDFVSVVLLAIAALPWLRGIVSKVELPGGAAITLADRRRAVMRDQQETIDAFRAVATAGQEIPSSEKLASVYELGREYEEVRAAMPPGQQRTWSMGQVARQILALMPLDSYIPENDLLSPESGRRLVAYLSLVVVPDGTYAEILVQTLTEREGIPYNQSWALRALNRIIEENGEGVLSDRSIRQLSGMRDGLKPGLDRQLLLVDLVDRVSLPDTAAEIFPADQPVSRQQAFGEPL